MANNQDIQFICNARRPNQEWINGKYNVAFTGKMKDEQGLRDYIQNKIEELTTMQMITLFLGTPYDVVVGNDVEGVA